MKDYKTLTETVITIEVRDSFYSQIREIKNKWGEPFINSCLIDDIVRYLEDIAKENYVKGYVKGQDDLRSNQSGEIF